MAELLSASSVALRARLHHATYGRLGFEETEELVALCDRHHKSVQTLIDVHRYSFATAPHTERHA